MNWFTFVRKSILLSSWNYSAKFRYTLEIYLCNISNHRLQYALSSGIIIFLFQAFQLMSWFKVFRFLQLIVAYIGSQNAWYRYIFISLSVHTVVDDDLNLCKLKAISCSLNHSQKIHICKNLYIFGVFTLINSQGISL